jgi:hypothetical protein
MQGLVQEAACGVLRQWGAPVSALGLVSPGVSGMRSVFEYTDYRRYLHDFYHYKKRTNPYYSYRLFSMKAGFKAPNLLKLVMDGQRNLTRESVDKFVHALRLSNGEAAYFTSLVLHNQGAFPVRRGVRMQPMPVSAVA